MVKKVIKKQEEIDFEIRFYEGILDQSPDFVEALMLLGDLYTKRGLYKKGLTIDVKLSYLRPKDPFVFYNLACSYALTENIPKALKSVKLAIENGYDDFTFLEQDEDLKNLLDDSHFCKFLTKVKREKRKRL